MLDRVKSMAAFVAVVDTHSFAKAAQMCEISTAMVGKHVRFLEERVGAKLLNRTTRTQSLTEIGRIYYERCKQVLADIEDAEACADEMRATPRGLLKIHAPVSFGSQRLAPALAAYLRRYPEVKIDLTLADRDVDLVEEGYEAAIRIGPLADSALIVRVLKPYTMWLCASPEYLSKNGTPRNPKDLADHNCLGFTYWRKKDVWRIRKDGETEAVSVSGRLTTNNGQALRAAAVAGLGIIMQPEVLVADDVAAERLNRILADCDLPLRPMYLIYQPDRRLTPKLKTFIDFVVASFA